VTNFAKALTDSIACGYIFNHIIAVFPPKKPLDAVGDARLADQSRRILEVQIPLLYERFHDQVDGIDRKINCTRAMEAPRFHRGAFDPNLPICRRGHNKECNVEAFIREKMAPRVGRLRQIAQEVGSEQLERTCKLIERVAGDENSDLSSNECRSAGDALIAISAEGLQRTSITNRQEWALLAVEIGAELVEIEYEKP
jgi:hypothetical protein